MCVFRHICFISLSLSNTHINTTPSSHPFTCFPLSPHCLTDGRVSPGARVALIDTSSSPFISVVRYGGALSALMECVGKYYLCTCVYESCACVVVHVWRVYIWMSFLCCACLLCVCMNFVRFSLWILECSGCVVHVRCECMNVLDLFCCESLLCIYKYFVCVLKTCVHWIWCWELTQ